MTIEELKVLVPNALCEAYDLNSAQIAYLSLVPEILALVEAQIGLKYANGVWTGAKVLDERLEAFLTKLAEL